MSRRYHINPKTGRPNICHAKTPERCIYAKDGQIPEHYDTKEDAREAYAKSMASEILPTASASSGGTPKGETFSSGVAVFVKGDDPEHPEMYRMYATKDVRGYAKPGDKGGLVENPENVRDNAWVDEGSWVRGNGTMNENAVALNGSSVADNARVSGNAVLRNSTVLDESLIDGNAVVEDTDVGVGTIISGNAVVKDSTAFGQIAIRGMSSIQSSQLSGFAQVLGDSDIRNSVIAGEIKVLDSFIYDSFVDESTVRGGIIVQNGPILRGAVVIRGVVETDI